MSVPEVVFVNTYPLSSNILEDSIHGSLNSVQPDSALNSGHVLLTFPCPKS